MKENRYDDPLFFEAYSRFPRSVEGLSAAGEWPALEALLPRFTGRRVLDLGCGFGWHCRYAAAHGAAYVLGVDLSGKMLAVARQNTADPAVEYRRAAIEEVECPPAAFDVVLSSLALHYVADFGGLCRRVAGWLTPGGSFVFSAEHPVFTAAGPQSWACGPEGQNLHWPVDRYFEDGPRDAVFLGSRVTKYHRPMAAYVNGLLGAGLALTGFAEPTPPARMLAEDPALKDELRRPMMVIFAARKPE